MNRPRSSDKRPVTLQVQKVITHSNTAISNIDIEIKPGEAVRLIECLREQNCQDENTIRVRLLGKLVIS